MQLVLSLFPGIGLLDMAFEEEGFCVVRGPDLLWGGDVHRFHPPAGRFDGVIGGPPCQAHSHFSHLVRAAGRTTAPDLIPEFERCVNMAQPAWFLMENVWESQLPVCSCYSTHSFLLNNRWLGEEQNRKRKFTFGLRRRAQVDLREFMQLAALEPVDWYRTVLASGGMKKGQESSRGRKPGKVYGYCSARTVNLALQLQGLPADFFNGSPFTVEGKQRMIGNGVPLPMGRAIARAVRLAVSEDVLQSVGTESDQVQGGSFND